MCPSKKLFIIHATRKKISIQKKLIKIETFENKTQFKSFKKSIIICCLKKNYEFFQSIYFFNHVSYVKSL
jgi:hypothetical protein